MDRSFGDARHEDPPHSALAGRSCSAAAEHRLGRRLLASGHIEDGESATAAAMYALRLDLSKGYRAAAFGVADHLRNDPQHPGLRVIMSTMHTLTSYLSVS